MRFLLLVFLIGCAPTEQSNLLARADAENVIDGRITDDALSFQDVSNRSHSVCCDARGPTKDTYQGPTKKIHHKLPDIDVGPHAPNDIKIPDMRAPDIAIDIKEPDIKVPKPDSSGWR